MRETYVNFIETVSSLQLLTFSFTDPVEDLLLTGLDDSFCSSVSFREAVELVYYIAYTQERVKEILIVVFHFYEMYSNYTHLFLHRSSGGALTDKPG